MKRNSVSKKQSTLVEQPKIVYLSSNLPEPTTNSELFTRDSLCVNLLKIAKQRKIAKTYSDRYQSHYKLASEFNLEEVNGELLTTITQVINAWEVYWDLKHKRKTSHNIQLSPNTDLSTFGFVVGYLVTSFKNNMSKKYTKFTTEKRSSAKQFIYLDSSQEEHINNSYEGLIAEKTGYIDNYEYKDAISFLIRELRKIDKVENEKQQNIYAGNPVPMKRKSYLAKLFVALLNPRYQGNLDQIRINFGWTDYIFKRNKSILFEKMQTDYSELGINLLNYVVNSQHDRNIGEIKEKEKAKTIKKKAVANSVFGMKVEGNKTKYYLTVTIDEVSFGGKQQTIQVVKQHEIISNKKKPISYDEAKTKLTEKANGDLLKAKCLAANM